MENNIDIKPEDLRIFTVDYKTAEYKERLKDGREVKRKVIHPVVKEYVDMSTGEIISASFAKTLGLTELNYAVMKLKQNLVLNLLRKEVRDFADFLLRFRNRRRGISPDLDTICQWYSELTGIRKNNVVRYVPTLKEAGILASDVLLMPLFQISGKDTKASDHLSEDFDAEIKFLKLKKQRRNHLKSEEK